MIDEDYFKELYSNSVLKHVTLGFFFTGVLLGLAFESGIIWYEKSGYHRYRTAINQLFAFVSWIVIAYIVLVFIPEGVRYIAGPLDSTLCDIHNFLKNWICASLLLTFDSIIVLRYIFIFKVNNFAVINDDFVTLLLQMSIAIIGFWVSLVNRLSIGKMSLNYFLCSGKNPELELSEIRRKTENGTLEAMRNATDTTDAASKKLDTTSLIALVSFFIHIAMFAKIFLYQRKVEKEKQNVQLGRMEPDLKSTTESNKSVGLKRGNPKIMADLLTHVLIVTFLSVYTGILITMHCSLEPIELNSYEYRWIVYWNQILGVSVSIIGIAGSYYLRNPYLMATIWRNVKTFFHSCMIST